MTDKTGDFKLFFQRFNQTPVFDRDVRHIADYAAFRIDEARQDYRDGNQLADFALARFNKRRNGVKQRMFQRLLSALRQRVVLFSHHFTAQIVQRESRVMTAKTNADCVEIAGFGDNRYCAAAPGGGLLIDFLISPRSIS